MFWLDYLNRALTVLAALLCTTAVVFFATSFKGKQSPPPPQVHKPALHFPFAQSEEDYAAIGTGSLLALPYAPPKAELPDLRNELIYYGVNERPDADPNHPLIHLALSNAQTKFALPAGEPLYLKFDRQANAYVASPDNAQTNLWLTARPTEGALVISVAMVDSKGDAVEFPPQHAKFMLTPTTAHTMQSGWQLGPYRVDNSLLARMHTRWYGQDRFLFDHGGEEWSHTRGKERLDFGQGENLYSCFVGVGDCLVFKDNRWHNRQLGEPSRDLPLLSVKAIKEKLMLLELWDAAGRARLTLSVMRARDMALPKHIRDTIRFVGARTWSELVLCLGKERVVVSPQEWLLLNEEGWQVLQTVDAIDAYVTGRLRGELMVLEGVERDGGAQTVTAHLYNISRTGVEQLSIPVMPQTAPATIPQNRSAGLQDAAHPLNEGEDLSEQEQLLSLPTVIRGLVEKLREETP